MKFKIIITICFLSTSLFIVYILKQHFDPIFINYNNDLNKVSEINSTTNTERNNSSLNSAKIISKIINDKQKKISSSSQAVGTVKINPTAPNNIPPLTNTSPGTTFLENFSTKYMVKEIGNSVNRTSPGWWLGSGAYFYSGNGIGKTVVGSLPDKDPWRVAYSLSNPIDTDDGYHPQNIFRLVLMRGKWLNFQQEGYFKIINLNLSDSPNRDASNGLLFFNRYQDEFTLYYTGIRVDGTSIIKKKVNGVYYTLAEKPIFKSGTDYDRDTDPNLLPISQWIGLRSQIQTNPDNTVSIKLYIDKDSTGIWTLAAEATDDGKTYGGSPILGEGYAGIRTDFMDVEFKNYNIKI